MAVAAGSTFLATFLWKTHISIVSPHIVGIQNMTKYPVMQKNLQQQIIGTSILLVFLHTIEVMYHFVMNCQTMRAIITDYLWAGFSYNIVHSEDSYHNREILKRGQAWCATKAPLC